MGLIYITYIDWITGRKGEDIDSALQYIAPGKKRGQMLGCLYLGNWYKRGYG